MKGVSEIVALLNAQGAKRYGGEAVSQLSHALQCAALAESEAASEHLVAVALLHDIGHLLAEENRENEARKAGTDLLHEVIGEKYLSRLFDERVCRPVGLHVKAKQHLCAAEATYFDTLSAASKSSLMRQGGPLSASAMRDFLGDPFAQAALSLRRWDDGAKVPGRPTPGLEYYEKVLRSVALS